VSAEGNQIVGALVQRDGKLQPVQGADPSAQWTYRPEALDVPESTNKGDT
jgi:hypothetical protein